MGLLPPANHVREEVIRMNESDRNKDIERQRGRNGMQKGINAPNDERTPLVLDLETTGVEEEFIRTHRMNGIPLEVKNE
jgi:hypothetical protein